MVVTLKLLELICYRADEGDGDELFIKLNKVKVWPQDGKYIKVSEGSTKLKANVAIELGNEIVLELWDYDILSPNDKLGEFRMIADQRGAEFKTDLGANKSGAKYTLRWELS